MGLIRLWRLSSRCASSWTDAVSRAEHLVGSPTSVSNFRSLLGEDVSTIGTYAKRLVGSQHPFLETAREFIFGNGNERQFRGLAVLLFSKSLVTVRNPEVSDAEPILPKQRALAEICELIHAATLVHGSTVNLSQVVSEGKFTMRSATDDFLFANKMSVLGGDFLLANACTALARLHNVQVVHSMSSAISDCMEGEFIVPTEASADMLLPWAAGVSLRGGSLLGRSCEAAALLAGHSEPIQQAALSFGRHLGIAHVLMASLRTFNSSFPAYPLAVTLAPIVFAASSPFQYIAGEVTLAPSPCQSGLYPHSEAFVRMLVESGGDQWTADAWAQVRDRATSLEGPKRCLEAAVSHTKAAMDAVAVLPPSEAREALRHMAEVVTSE